MVTRVDIGRKMSEDLLVDFWLVQVTVQELIVGDLRLSVSRSHGKRKRNRPSDDYLGCCSILSFVR